MLYTIRYTASGAEVRQTGTVTAAEVAVALRAAAAHRYPDRRRYALFDATRVERFDIPPDEVRAIAELPGVYGSPDTPLAIAAVVPDEMGFTLARSWQRYTQLLPLETTVLRTRAIALMWLQGRGVLAVDLPPDSLD
jgi:hypothetical protein